MDPDLEKRFQTLQDRIPKMGDAELLDVRDETLVSMSETRGDLRAREQALLDAINAEISRRPSLRPRV